MDSSDRKKELHKKYSERLMNIPSKNIPKTSFFSVEKSHMKETDRIENDIIQKMKKMKSRSDNKLGYDSDEDEDEDLGIGVLTWFDYTEKLEEFKKGWNPSINKKLQEKISILLGPRIFFNHATAQQIFHNPESSFYWQFYSILLNVAQTYFQASLMLGNQAEAFAQLDAFHQKYLESRELKIILETFVRTYGETFSHFKEKSRAFFNRVFNGNQLLDSLLETIEKTGEAYYESAPEIRGLPLPAQNHYDTITQSPYTLETLQSFLDSQEKIRYQQFVSDYLQTYPEEASYLKEVFELGDVSIEKIPEILAKEPFQLPSIQSIKQLMNIILGSPCDIWPREIAKEFRIHGNFSSIYDFSPIHDFDDWQDLKEIISCYSPTNPADAAFRQEMLIYCSKSHDKKRFDVLRRGLDEFFEGKYNSLLQAVYEKTVLKKKFYGLSYRLLEIADSCMKIAPEKMAPFFEALPEKIAIFQPALFEEARNLSSLQFIWLLGSAILEKQQQKANKSEATTSEDSVLSDGTPRFEEVDENGEPLNPVMNSKASFDEEDEEMKTDEAALKTTSELMPASVLSESEYQARQARQRELFLKILMQSDGEYRSWRKIREILVDESEKYKNMPSCAETGLSWKLWHGGSQSIKNSNDLKDIGEETLKSPAELVKKLDKLQEYLLKKL